MRADPLKKVLLIDNYDSFTYNIYHALIVLGKRVEIVRPHETFCFDDDKIDGLVIGPGPGAPEDAHFSLKAITHFSRKIPILGICLGHQCLAHYWGAKIGRAEKPMHGKQSEITHDGKGLFENLPSPCSVIRYHSLAVLEVSEPLVVTARTLNGEIMGLRHKSNLFESVQFHPDSIMTKHGPEIFLNFLKSFHKIGT